jgi:hypothetical protein
VVPHLGGPEVKVGLFSGLEKEGAVAGLDLGDLIHHSRIVLGVKLHFFLVVG